MKRIIPLILALCLLLTACAAKDPYAEVPNPIATITMSDGSSMRFELMLSAAPNTVANFVELSNRGFYDGMYFFRVVPGVLIQTGDRTGEGTGDAGYYIQGEFRKNGITNTLSHARGVLSMARLEAYDTASSQFFIMDGMYPEYDGSYAAFGTALDQETLAVIDHIATLPVDGSYRPYGEYPTIVSIRVNTHGYEYEAAKIEKKTDEKS